MDDQSNNLRHELDQERAARKDERKDFLDERLDDQTRARKLENQILKLKDDNNKLSSQVTQLMVEKTPDQTELHKHLMRGRTEVLEHRRQEYDEARRELKDQIDQQLVEIQSLEQERDNLFRQNEELDLTIDGLQTQVNELTSAKEQLEQQLVAAQNTEQTLITSLGNA